MFKINTEYFGGFVIDDQSIMGSIDKLKEVIVSPIDELT